MKIVADQITANEVLTLIREGKTVHCPTCREKLCAVPENWSVGEPLLGVQCSNEPSHFYIRCQDAGIVKEARSRMREIIGKGK